MVVTLNIAIYDVDRMLVDNRSSMDVLSFDALLKMNIASILLGRMCGPLIGFSRDPMLVEGTIMLLIIAGQSPQ